LDPIKGIEDLISMGVIKQPVPEYLSHTIYKKNMIKIVKE